jgi:acyl-CoA reductase-like NAD-dependent aldehyde dehydrogenase
MSPLLEKALEKVGVLPQAEQDAIASQILASLADEEAWRKRFAEKRDIIRRLAREALEEDARGPIGQKIIPQGATLGKGMNGR